VSQENVEIVRAAFASDARLSDYDRLAPDAEFDFTSLPDQALLHGATEMRAWPDRGPWGRYVSLIPEHYFDVDDERVLVFVRATAVGQESGTPVDIEVAHEFTLQRGLIVRVKVFVDRAEALKAVGLED
jgi:hypothetical protein